MTTEKPKSELQLVMDMAIKGLAKEGVTATPFKHHQYNDPTQSLCAHVDSNKCMYIRVYNDISYSYFNQDRIVIEIRCDRPCIQSNDFKKLVSGQYNWKRMATAIKNALPDITAKNLAHRKEIEIKNANAKLFAKAKAITDDWNEKSGHNRYNSPFVLEPSRSEVEGITPFRIDTKLKHEHLMRLLEFCAQLKGEGCFTAKYEKGE